MLSAQTKDVRVNQVTKVLFEKYQTIEELAAAKVVDIEEIIKPLGTYRLKARNIVEIAKKLVLKPVCNDREYLESLSGIGRKTTNVVLSELYNEPCLAVDTHINRIAKRLGFALEEDKVDIVERKLTALIPDKNVIHIHHQLIFFGRYHCKAINPNCKNCKLKDMCKYEKRYMS